MAHPDLAIEKPTNFLGSIQSPPNSKILIGSVLLYCSYKAAMPITVDDDQDHFASHIISLIDKYLACSEPMLSDDDIAIVVSACMFEVFVHSLLLVHFEICHLNSFRMYGEALPSSLIFKVFKN